MLSMSESDHYSTRSLVKKSESDPDNLKLIMNQYIDRLAQQCQHQMQANLDQIWIAAEQEHASLAQRMVSDHLAMVDEGTSSLPNYHPLHWFQSQLEFQLQGVLEFRNQEVAQNKTQEILEQLQAAVSLVIASQQTAIAEEFDRQIQNIRKSLATDIQPQLQEKRVMIAEYVNSYISVARLQLREVDKFGFFLNGQRISPNKIVISTTTTVSPWYLLGLRKQQQSVYQLSLQQLKPLLQESLARTFDDIQTQIASYIETDLHSQIQSLLASV
jgi:predicted transcriptional regulator